jgi:ferrous iron transport protein B
MSKRITIALAGNPNSGKTTVFNSLTGARQHVGNYPGVTVEKKEGTCRHKGREIHVVDLPGTYSLTAYSLEELVARNFVIDEKPDVVVDIVDASNLERNLYLTTQFIELGVPVVVALNMSDVATADGKSIDAELLGQLIGVPVVPTVGHKGQGMQALLDAVVRVADTGVGPLVSPALGHELEPHVREITDAVRDARLPDSLSARWIAIKLLENDDEVHELVREHSHDGERVCELTQDARQHIEGVVGDDAEIALADRRYGFIAGACREAVTLGQRQRLDWSDAIDSIVANRVVGIPILVGFMWALFELVFRLGAPPTEWIQAAFAWLSTQVAAILPDGALQSLLADGIIGGVGGVLVFLPQILLLFLGIAFLEDTGYMARAAFVVDRLMHAIGLHGRSAIPLLIGFGCNVPAVMATRTLESRRDRLTTMLIVPFMSCSARLPVYVLLAGAFFAPDVAGKVILSLYMLGAAVGVIMAKLFRRFVLRGPTTPFVMELPPYRMPTLRGVLIHMWERGWLYVKKAGTIILAASVVMWFLLSYPAPPPAVADLPQNERAAAALAYSYAGRIGQSIEPVLRPLGLDWKVGIGLVAGLAAKEVVVATFGTVYSLGEADEESADLRDALRRDPQFDPLTAYALMVFVLLYVPCMATVAVIKRETNSWRWAAFVIFYTCAIAWIVAFLVSEGGRLLGLA